jgi:hypothetical protein
VRRSSGRLWDEKATQDPSLCWNRIEAAKLLEQARADLPATALQNGWDFLDAADPEINTGIDQDGDASDADPLSQDRDPTFTLRDYQEAREMDSEEAEPSSSGAWECRMDRIDLARQRAPKKQKPEDRVLAIDDELAFHTLPKIEGVPLDETSGRETEQFWRPIRVAPRVAVRDAILVREIRTRNLCFPIRLVGHATCQSG